MEDYKELLEYKHSEECGHYAVFYLSKGPHTVNVSGAINDKEIWDKHLKDKFIDAAREKCKKLLEKASNTPRP